MAQQDALDPDAGAPADQLWNLIAESHGVGTSE
jgi:hypothetical protein